MHIITEGIRVFQRLSCEAGTGHFIIYMSIRNNNYLTN